MNAYLLLFGGFSAFFGVTGYLDARDSNVTSTILVIVGLGVLALGFMAPPSV